MRSTWKRTTAIAAVALLAGTLATGAAFAAGWGGQRQGAGIARAYRLALRKAQLSSDQQAKVKAMMRAERPALQSLKAQRETDRAALQAALAAATPDPAAVGNAVLKLRADRQDLRGELKKMHDATLQLLTPEQRATFQAYLDAFRMMHRRGGRFDG